MLKTEKKIKLQEGSYKYKGYFIERMDKEFDKSYVHWNIGSENEYGDIEWHDAANTLKDAIWMIDNFGEKK